MCTKKLFIISLLSILLASLNAAPVPKWLSNIETSYPNSKYIARMGQGTSIENARADGLGQIANYFNSNIKTTTIGESRMTNVNGEVSKEQQINKITTITSQIEMIGISYSESYTNKKENQTYIVVYIDRDIAWKMLEPDILNALNSYQSLYNLALNTEEKILQYEYLYKSMKSGEKLIEKLYYGFLINPAKYTEYQEIINRITKDPVFGTLSEQTIPLYLKVNGDYGNTISSILIEIFNEFGFIVSTNSNTSTQYILTVSVEDNLVQADDIFAIYPSIEMNLTNVSQSKTFYSWSKKWGKTANFSLDKCQKKAYYNISNDLKDLIPADYKKKLLN